MISKQRSSVGSAMSPSTQPFLKVSVTDPFKMRTGVQAYVSYRVITKTNMPEYRGPEKIVIRRYSDFVWLHERLAEKNKGIFIPPLPEKSAVGRHRGLDVFINRIASHSQLQHSEDLKHFLQAEEEIVYFRCLDKPKEDEFCLELSKLSTYDDVVERVAQQLGLDDPSKIRLTSHNCHSQEPKPQPIKYRGVDHLSDMLVHYNQSSDILYYEVLDIPMPELQGFKSLKVAFHHSTKDEVSVHSIRLPKQSTVGDVINELRTKVELSHPTAEIRLLEVFYHKIYKIFPPNEKIENINDQYWTLRAEEIPEEEKNLGPHDRLIHVYHFTRDALQNHVVQNFGEPFFLGIREGETLSDVKERIQKKLQVPDEEFSKWKFAFLSLCRPDYLQDTDVILSCFQGKAVYGAWEQYLGLEHSDSAPKLSHQTNQNHHTFEKPVKIYN